MGTPSLLEDQSEILQLLYRYSHAFDSGDSKGLASLLTDDSTLDAAGQVLAGRDAQVDFASHHPGMRHVVVNPIFEITDNAALVRSYVFVFKGTTAVANGSYEDQLVRTHAGWRLSKRVFTPDASQ
jgi:SnoaL-like domain